MTSNECASAGSVSESAACGWIDNQMQFRYPCHLTTSRFVRIRGAVFGLLKPIVRPPPPALGYLGNCKQPGDFIAITGVDAKYISNGQIMIGSLHYPDLISGPHITLDDYS